MTKWELTGESNYAPVNVFPARNLRKGGTNKGGNWIVAFNDEQNTPRKVKFRDTIKVFIFEAMHYM